MTVPAALALVGVGFALMTLVLIRTPARLTTLFCGVIAGAAFGLSIGATAVEGST